MYEQIKASTNILGQALNGLSLRQKVTANNLANADTPGYLSQKVSFEENLRAKLEKTKSDPTFQTRYTHENHIPLGLPNDNLQMVQELRGVMRNDDNGVDLEQEMTSLASAQVAYSTVSQILNGRYAAMKYVISEGGR